MLAATGGALRHAVEVAGSLSVDAARMGANLEASRGLVLAEAAVFALAEHMPRPEAQALAKAACASVTDEDRHLVDLLRSRTDAPVDWARLREPGNHVGEADALIERVLAGLRG